MKNQPLSTILWLWSELEQAYHGSNGFGGHEAEIYVYRFLRFDPGHLTTTTVDDGNIREALTSLYEILAEFSRRREASIRVNGRALSRQMIASDQRHRFHIRVTPRRGRR